LLAAQWGERDRKSHVEVGVKDCVGLRRRNGREKGKLFSIYVISFSVNFFFTCLYILTHLPYRVSHTSPVVAADGVYVAVAYYYHKVY
jgi:hypothetical protein